MTDKNDLNFSAIILAAGKGTRMNSTVHKPLHAIGNRPMVSHVIKAYEEAGAKELMIVKAPDDEIIDSLIGDHPSVIQPEQNGTGHAGQIGLSATDNPSGVIIFAIGDMPLIEPETIRNLAASDKDLTVLAMRPEDTKRYGRLIVDESGHLEKIVEYKDANPAERKVDLCNSGTIAVRSEHATKLLAKIENNNKAGEYYLTDLVAIANEEGLACGVVEASARETAAANSRPELAQLEGLFQERARERAMEAGATLIDPSSVYFSADTVVDQDCLIEPHVIFGLGVTIESNVTIHAFSYIQHATIKQGAKIGPFARLRGNSEIGEASEIGNFVEVNRSSLGKGVKAKHLAYMGDGEIGDKANIAAGTILANYDGFFKHKTVIGESVLTGSNCTIKAPVTIGDNAIIAAGSVITDDVASGDLAIARAHQETKSGWAEQYRKEKSAEKENKGKKSKRSA